jgi:hyperosmotically inducible periplasmic protein
MCVEMLKPPQKDRPMVTKLAAAFVLLLVPLLLPPVASAAPQERRDSQIGQDVANQILSYGRFTVFDEVNIQVEQGIVRLSGKVTMPDKPDEIARRASRVDGVKSVENRITVLPLSPFDDDLRFQVARAIYGNPAFWSYASMANPPIHIIVEHGRVTLTGVVNSDMERSLARSLASRSSALSVKNELKTDAEVKADLERIR